MIDYYIICRRPIEYQWEVHWYPWKGQGCRRADSFLGGMSQGFYPFETVRRQSANKKGIRGSITIRKTDVQIEYSYISSEIVMVLSKGGLP